MTAGSNFRWRGTGQRSATKSHRTVPRPDPALQKQWLSNNTFPNWVSVKLIFEGWQITFEWAEWALKHSVASLLSTAFGCVLWNLLTNQDMSRGIHAWSFAGTVKENTVHTYVPYNVVHILAADLLTINEYVIQWDKHPPSTLNTINMPFTPMSDKYSTSTNLYS